MIVMYNRDCRYDRDYSPSKDYYHSNYGRNGVTKDNVVTTIVTTRVVLQCESESDKCMLLFWWNPEPSGWVPSLPSES